MSKLTREQIEAIRDGWKHQEHVWRSRVPALCDTALKLMEPDEEYSPSVENILRDEIRKLTEERDAQVEDLSAAYLQLVPAGSPIPLPLGASVTHWARKMREERDRLREALEAALKHGVANLGTKHEFYTCYTYEHGEMPEWVGVARAALEES